MRRGTRPEHWSPTQRPGNPAAPEPGEPGRAFPAARLLHAGPERRGAGQSPRRPEPPAPRAAPPRRPCTRGVSSTAAAAAAAGQPNVSCTCNCKRSLFQSMEIGE